jgi:SHS2 domain-containing protein
VPYELLPHTADLRVRLYGADLDQLYAGAVDFVRETLVGESPVRPATTRTLQLPPGLSEDERLLRFIRELLYLFDVEGWLPARSVGARTESVSGECFDPSRHALQHQVKAVTRHRYAFEKTAAGYEAELVLDL